MAHNIEDLIGKKIKRIFASQEYLKFETEEGDIAYTVEGDCCSNSVFYDFLGVQNLLKNGVVVSAKEIELARAGTDIRNGLNKYSEQDKNGKSGLIQAYGFELVTEDPQFGEVTSVFSFRNYSNGYYGGRMKRYHGEVPPLPEITTDTTHIEGDALAYVMGE